MRRREAVLALLILVLLGLIGLRSPVFLTLGSLEDVLTDTSILVMLAVGQMLVILTRGIDISVASNLAFTGMFVALLSQSVPTLPVPVFMFAAAAIGLTLGAVNGFFVAVVGIPPIVTTLGTLSAYRGLIFVLSKGAWVSSHEMSQAFQQFPMATFLGVTHLVWIAGAVSALAWVFLNHTRTGRALYAAGGNPLAAQYVGISVPRMQFLVFCLSGLIAGLAGYLWVARFAIAFTEVAIGFELVVIAACVIGGVSIAGGIGTVPGVVLGALFLGVIGNALPVIQVSPFFQMAISGTVILAAVIVNSRSEKRSGKLIVRRQAVPEQAAT